MDLAFRRIAIVNRGEPAMRLIHAVRELNQQHGDHLQTIALYTDPDRRAMFVREADERYYLGPPSVVDPRDGERKAAYLDYGRLERALVETNAEAVWVGWGFVAEHAEFADLCDRLAINFIGPSGDVMRRMGDKIASKICAEEADVPVTPWSNGPIESLDHAREVADRLGYPLMIKSTAGGGGRGMRRVKSPDELEVKLESARNEALKGFGNGTLFIESLVLGARHIEVQIIADKHGEVWPVGVRDCTVQRRNQKVIEEAPSPGLTEAEHAEVLAAARRLAQHAGYYNAGTVECLFDPAARRFYFMEMNTRLQVEHCVTEETTGLDLVKTQLRVASGGRLEGSPPPTVGHAIEVRLNAEDPDAGFAPAPGLVQLFDVPTGPGIRVDTGVAAGDQVAPDFDSMIAKIIAHGRDRAEAMGRLRRALLESSVVIRGGSSNKAFLLELLGHPDVVKSEYDIGWLDRLTEHGALFTHRPLADIALVRAAIEVYEQELAVEKSGFFTSASRGRPKLRAEIGRTVELNYNGQSYELSVFKVGPQLYRVRVDGRTFDATYDPLGELAGFIEIDGTRYRVLAMVDGPSHLIEINGLPHRISREEGGVIRAGAPGLVLSLAAQPGDQVEAGAPLAVLEAMKMELTIKAPFTGRVRSIDAMVNQQVAAGAPLMTLEKLEDEHASSSSERVLFRHDAAEAGPASLHERSRRLFTETKRLLLGYDIDDADAKRLRAQRPTLVASLAPDDPDLLADEDDLLHIFGDLLAVFDDAADGEPAAPLEHLQNYLRSLDAEGERLPESFLEKLRAALRHYGVDSLKHTPELDTALLFLHKARARLDESAQQVVDVLTRRLEHADALRPSAAPPRGDEARARLEQLVARTHHRYLALHDLARKLRYVLYERPAFEAAREATEREMRAHIESLLASPPAADPAARAEQLAPLVDCPQPISTLFAPSFAESGDARRLAVEVMLRRFYRTRALEQVRVETSGGFPVARAEHRRETGPGHILAVAASFDDVEAAVRALEPLARGLDPSCEITTDIYLGAAPDLDDAALAGQIEKALTASAAKSLGRVCAVVAGAGRSLRSFTFTPTEMGVSELEVLRGVHPMQAERLELWRLERFTTQQLRSADDVHVFHAVARDNPKDERLFVFVEVRDMTPVRDEHGGVAEIPGLEHLFLEAMAEIRDFQARRQPRQRLQWNRVILHVRPVVDLPPEEIHRLARRLAPAGQNLGMDGVEAHITWRNPASGVTEEKVIHVADRSGTGLEVRIEGPSNEPFGTLTPYDQKVVRLRRLGVAYPYEIIRMMTSQGMTEFPPGRFEEHDLDETGQLVPVDRPPGENQANVVLGVITNYTDKYPEGMTRVICLGDGSKGMGSLAEPECRRVNAGLDLAASMGVPFEWFAVSSGAKISMDVGTEGLDWVARTLRKLVTHTQAGHEVNIIVPGVNVGGQSYWNAEATMLMHTRGILIMTPQAAMVLTGKKALDYSGGVSAETNLGIGGGERIMGPNGQAQYLARDVGHACQILLRYYDHSYVLPGERWPRRAPTKDPVERDPCDAPHPQVDAKDFTKIGEIFSDETNPGRKRPFDIRAVMRATLDQDHEPLERWQMMRKAETAVVWDAHLGGIPVSMVGMESKPVPRLGFVPGDGPDTWTGGTLFPGASKKVARAINAASGNRPVVVLANLSGFDGSPESLREWQLEFGAEIGRAVVNFQGPLVFCAISRYHGGAYVVFSCTLNENMRVSALEGSYASVIGGAPAAAVVFPREVRARVLADPRVQAAQKALREAKDDVAQARARAEHDRVMEIVHAEKQGEVAENFDHVHSVQRAKDVGSIHEIISPADLRKWLVQSVERGMAVDTTPDTADLQQPTLVPGASAPAEAGSTNGDTTRPS
jgi:acetyl/propionyl-CoA carboxylase alpha subunit/acetyl-CoA carboxylase carboxyltransferase component